MRLSCMNVQLGNKSLCVVVIFNVHYLNVHIRLILTILYRGVIHQKMKFHSSVCLIPCFHLNTHNCPAAWWAWPVCDHWHLLHRSCRDHQQSIMQKKHQ